MACITLKSLVLGGGVELCFTIICHFMNETGKVREASTILRSRGQRNK